MVDCTEDYTAEGCTVDYMADCMEGCTVGCTDCSDKDSLDKGYPDMDFLDMDFRDVRRDHVRGQGLGPDTVPEILDMEVVSDEMVPEPIALILQNLRA
jgi:hypothetical protein